jgi:C2H2 type zinc-finger (2 copies)
MDDEHADASTARGASERGAGAEADPAWEEWDVRASLFDGHVSPSFAANLEYMYKKYGFYFPDAEYLADPEGLLKYLVSARLDLDRQTQRGPAHAPGERAARPG